MSLSVAEFAGQSVSDVSVVAAAGHQQNTPEEQHHPGDMRRGHVGFLGEFRARGC